MSPPTLAIVALMTLQYGLVRLGYPALPRLLSRPGPRRVLGVANRYGMPVFLLHLSGYLLAQAIGWPQTAGLVLALGCVLLLRRSIVDGRAAADGRVAPPRLPLEQHEQEGERGQQDD